MQSERLVVMPRGAVTYLVACESTAWCQLEYVAPSGYLVTGYAHSGYLSFLPPGARRARAAYASGAALPGYAEPSGAVHMAPEGTLLNYVAERAGGVVSAQGFYDDRGVWHPVMRAGEPVAECRDGTYDRGGHHQSVCYGHAGVRRWLR
jgi:hypothetical protein